MRSPPPGDHLPNMRYNPPTRTLTPEEHHEYRRLVLSDIRSRGLARAIHFAVWMDPARRPTMAQLRNDVCRELFDLRAQGWLTKYQ